MPNVEKKSGETKKGNKFLAFIKNLPMRILKSFKDMYAELKKVTWPTRKELMNYSLIVVAFLVVMGVVILGIDLLSAGFVNLISYKG